MTTDRLDDFNKYAKEHGLPGTMAEFALWNALREAEEQLRMADVRIASSRAQERDRCIRIVRQYVGTDNIAEEIRKGG